MAEEHKNDHDILIELKSDLKNFKEELREKLEDLKSTIKDKVDDHEERIRLLEQFHWKEVGAATALSFVLTLVIQVVLKMFAK